MPRLPDAELLARVNRGYGEPLTGFDLWARQLGGVMPPLLRSSRPPMRIDGPTQCERGHPLTHEHAADHLGRCRRCRAEGLAA